MNLDLDEFLKKREQKIRNMTLSQARDIIASTLSHSNMDVEFEKAVQMLLDCADREIAKEVSE